MSLQMIIWILLAFALPDLGRSATSRVRSLCHLAFRTTTVPVQVMVDQVGDLTDRAFLLGTRQMVFSDEAEESFARVFQGRGNTDAKVVKYFSLFLAELRLQLRPDVEKRFAYLLDRIVFASGSVSQHAHYNFTKKIVVVSLELAATDALSSLFVLLHELGHGLHDARDFKVSLIGKWSAELDRRNPIYPVASHFAQPYAESQAFGFSWEFLKRLPTDIREELITEYQRKIEDMLGAGVDWQTFASTREYIGLFAGMYPIKTFEQLYALKPYCFFLKALLAAGSTKKEFILRSYQAHGYSQAQIFTRGLAQTRARPLRALISIGILWHLASFL